MRQEYEDEYSSIATTAHRCAPLWNLSVSSRSSTAHSCSQRHLSPSMPPSDNEDDCLSVVLGARGATNLLYVTSRSQNIDIICKTCFAGFAGTRYLKELYSSLGGPCVHELSPQLVTGSTGSKSLLAKRGTASQLPYLRPWNANT